MVKCQRQRIFICVQNIIKIIYEYHIHEAVQGTAKNNQIPRKNALEKRVNKSDCFNQKISDDE